ncbi:hypothetical protein KKA09_03970 [Patescibacteria group bacterium]|nr:hypothetical protein [Patescibacteria group bacterium]
MKESGSPESLLACPAKRARLAGATAEAGSPRLAGATAEAGSPRWSYGGSGLRLKILFIKNEHNTNYFI